MDGIIFRTTDGTRWLAGKGSNLTPVEIDLNMWEFLTRIQELETSPPTAVSISNVQVVGSQMQFNMTDGSHFGPFTLPTATFEFRGDYAGGSTYNELDIISVPHRGLYLVRITHIAASTFVPTLVDEDANAVYQLIFGEDTSIYNFGFFYPGKPGQGIATNKNMASHLFLEEAYLYEDLGGSIAELSTASLTTLSFPLTKNNATVIGSVDFAIGATAGTFTFTDAVAFVAGDTIDMRRPTTIDVQARELKVMFRGARGTLES